MNTPFWRICGCRACTKQRRMSSEEDDRSWLFRVVFFGWILLFAALAVSYAVAHASW